MGVLPQIGSNLGVTDTVAGYAISAYALGVVVGAPLLTVIAARMSRRTLLLWLMGFYTVANVASAAAPDIVTLVIARFFAGLPHGAFFGVGAAAATVLVGPARRSRAVAVMMVGFAISNVVGVPVSAAIGQHLGWRATMIVLGIFGTIALLAMLRFVPADGPSNSSIRHEMSALANWPLWVGFFACALGFSGLFSLYTYIVPTLTGVTGLPEGFVPWVLAIFGVGMTCGAFLAGRIVDRDVRGAAIASLVLTSVLLAVFAAAATDPIGAVVSLFLLAASTQIFVLAIQTMLMDLAPQAPSLGGSLTHSAFNVGNSLGAFAGGLALAFGLGYTSPAWTGVGLTLIGLLVLLGVRYGRQATV